MRSSDVEVIQALSRLFWVDNVSTVQVNAEGQMNMVKCISKKVNIYELGSMTVNTGVTSDASAMYYTMNKKTK